MRVHSHATDESSLGNKAPNPNNSATRGYCLTAFSVRLLPRPWLKGGHHWVVDADLKSYFDTIRLGQRGARNDDCSFKSATKFGPQMVYRIAIGGLNSTSQVEQCMASPA